MSPRGTSLLCVRRVSSVLRAVRDGVAGRCRGTVAWDGVAGRCRGTLSRDGNEGAWGRMRVDVGRRARCGGGEPSEVIPRLGEGARGEKNKYPSGFGGWVRASLANPSATGICTSFSAQCEARRFQVGARPRLSIRLSARGEASYRTKVPRVEVRAPATSRKLHRASTHPHHPNASWDVGQSNFDAGDTIYGDAG